MKEEMNKEELTKLRKLLQEKGIKYKDREDKRIDGLYLDYGGYNLHVVFFENSDGYEEGLLEMLTDYLGEEPTGYHSAEDIMQMIGRMEPAKERKEEKYNNFKKKLLGEELDIPFDSNNRDKLNNKLNELLNKDEISAQEVKEILGVKISLTSRNRKNAVKTNDLEMCETEIKTAQKALNNLYVAELLRKDPTIVSHSGYDLDQCSSRYAIQQWARNNGIIDEEYSLNLLESKPGQTYENMVNVDNGGHKGSTYSEDKVIIDGGSENGARSAIEEISKTLIGADVPEQIIECADNISNKTNILDTKSGISLYKYTTIENTFKMAREGLLTRELSEEELEKYDLVGAQRYQQKIIDETIQKVQSYTKELPNGKKVVIAPEFIKGGSLVAYEMGAEYYASVSQKDEGSTFAINSKPGSKIPEEVKEFGNELVSKYKREDGSCGVFLHPNGQMLVAGGNKNPDFKVDMTQDEVMSKISTLFDDYARNDIAKEILEKSNETELLEKGIIEVEEKINKIDRGEKEEEKNK